MDPKKPLRKSITHDKVHPADWLNLDCRFSCEDCSHFSAKRQACTMGYNAKHHLRETQKLSFEMTGRMALCRFLEID